jgi:hypothetical protein
MELELAGLVVAVVPVVVPLLQYNLPPWQLHNKQTQGELMGMLSHQGNKNCPHNQQYCLDMTLDLQLNKLPQSE